MNYIYQEAVEELKLLGYKLKSLKRMKVRIAELESAKYSLGGSVNSSTPMPGGGTRYEDKIGTLIVNCDTVCGEYAALYGTCIPALAALDALPSDERIALDMCFVNRDNCWEARAARKLNISTTRVYQIKDMGLRRYANMRGHKK